MSSKIPRPKFITLDAYNTIYKPITKLSEQYNKITSSYSSSLQIPEDEFLKKFGKSFKTINSKYPNYGKATNLSIRQFWREILHHLYEPYNINAKLSDTEFNQMCDLIITHFETDKAYCVFPDVVPFLKQCQSKGIVTCIASNADSRVTKLIVDVFQLGKFFKNTIFLSYNLGVSKPDTKFFELIFENLEVTQGCKIDKLDVWHVGDEYDKDVVGALGFGLGGILIDREFETKYLQESDNVKIKQLESRLFVVNSLLDLIELFDLKE
ncbi:hypothetical protein CANARDRAFT_198473 [[Candida] arabinofermentans NRRL YB-2248]|uniref:Haloacid dehalogenase-like hydrolase n=1 Tax=[Candida] arabinofermentans NRRL YB-2248 TaxID=983967 RepID=A0A1E4T1G1_9ASCO|nr:hypothetical protein CANARDRAFT_198473 [[Candida] arabinofermentans NRRL YB-2248]